MKWFWLLAMLSSCCLGSIVRIDERVKKDQAYAVGTVIHETTGHMIGPEGALLRPQYKVEAIYRYRFGGVVREGKKQYLKILVQNVLLQNVVAANRRAWTNPKTQTRSPSTIAESKDIELLVLTQNGRAAFPLLVQVITPSTAERTEVMEAVLEIAKNKLRVLEVAQKTYPSSKLPWSPPSEWPRERATVYVESTAGPPK